MSYITNVLLITAVQEPGVEALNRLMQSSSAPWAKGSVFRDCDSVEDGKWYAGSTCLSVDVYPAAFNYLEITQLVEMINRVRWDEPAQVQLLLCDEDELQFRRVRLALSDTSETRAITGAERDEIPAWKDEGR